MPPILIVACIIGFFLPLMFFLKTPVTVKSHWQTFVDGLSTSTEEFYASVKQGLADRMITDVEVEYESFSERHIFSAKRLYLRITKDEYVYFVCSAPYGTGTFFSSWLCIKDERLLNKIPILNRLAGKDRNNKTFYQMDTANIFRSAVHATVTAIIDNLTDPKGQRGLSEFAKQFNDVK